jgi:hypothetical protein
MSRISLVDMLLQSTLKLQYACALHVHPLQVQYQPLRPNSTVEQAAHTKVSGLPAALHTSDNLRTAAVSLLKPASTVLTM